MRLARPIVHASEPSRGFQIVLGSESLARFLLAFWAALVEKAAQRRGIEANGRLPDRRRADLNTPRMRPGRSHNMQLLRCCLFTGRLRGGPLPATRIESTVVRAVGWRESE